MVTLWQDHSMTPPTALAISAHDPLGGAGAIADMTTFAAFGVHGVQAVTALTVQHFDSVDAVQRVDPDFVSRQIDAILDEVRPAAVKTGLLGSAEVVADVARRVADGGMVAPVVDPVLVDGRGNRIASDDIEAAYREELFPRARVITPNLREAQILAGRELRSMEEILAAAGTLAGLGADLVVVTAGALGGADAVDVAVGSDGSTTLIRSPRYETSNVRGSGCTFAAAITAALARGTSAIDAVNEAKRFVSAGISASVNWDLAGTKAGPVSHLMSPFT